MEKLRFSFYIPESEAYEKFFDEVVARLKQKGYHGFLSLEPHLGSFSGLEALEIDDAMTKLEKSSGKTYALAYESLKKILERI